MKKLRLILVVFGLLLTIISSGQTLTFRLANPNIVYLSGTNYFAFDVQMKASVAGSYLFSGQAVLSFATGNFSNTGGDWSVQNGELLQGTFGLSSNKYNASLLTLTGSPLKINVAWTANSGSVGDPATSAKFNEVTTAFKTVVTVYAPITAVTGMAGIDFDEVSMNGQQSYKINANPWYNSYTSPNLYDEADFMNTFMGRIFANSLWSQIGGAVDWSTAVNTSIWDGNATAGAGVEWKASALRIHSPASLNIPKDGKVTVSNNLDVLTATNGLTIQSDATGTGSLIVGSATGTSVVKRYMSGGTPSSWHLIASPVSGQGLSAFVGLASNNLAFNSPKWGLAVYDNSLAISAWVHYTAATLPTAGDFVAGKGYEILRSGDGAVSFIGVPAFGPIATAVINPGANQWWNLVGNPYPSAINANTGAGATNFLTTNNAVLESGYKALYFWDQPTSQYVVVNNATSAYYVPVAQGFFVRTVAGSSNANFANGMRTHQTNASFKGAQSEYPVINLNAAIAGNNRSTSIYYIPGTSKGIDEGFDAGMYESNPVNAVYTHIEGSEIGFAIQSLPESDLENMSVSVGLNGPQGATVNFTIDATNLPGGTKVYLEDKVTGKFTRLDESGSSYSVTLNSASQGTGRFFLHTTQGTMGIDNSVLGDITVIALPREHKIRVLGTSTPNSVATIYEMNGAVVGTKVLPNVGENEMPFSPVSNGVYLLKVQQTGTAAPTSVKINWIY